MVKKVTGYVVSVLGILVMATGLSMVNVDWELFNLLNLDYVAGFGIVLIVIGVIISMRGERGRGRGDGKDEIPIYEGVGKSRRIVGYRKG